MKKFLINPLLLLLLTITACAQEKNQPDVFNTSKGKLTIYFIGHGTLMFDFAGKIIHVDPWTKLADYTQLPKADLILVTHHHFDHMDASAIQQISKENTLLVTNAVVADSLHQGHIMKNGETKTYAGLVIEAVPAYNITPGREMFHPKGRDNGYILHFGNKKIYIAGDTEDIPEMKLLKDIDIAFLPMNQPYTMLPTQVVNAANMFLPKILYPYHYGDTKTEELTSLMAAYPKIEVRIKSMQ